MRPQKVKTNSCPLADLLWKGTFLASMLAAGCAPSTQQASNSTEQPGEVISGDPPPVLNQPAAPESYREGVTTLLALRDTVRDAFAAKDIDKAHGPLHDVGHLLEALPELFAKISTVESDRETVKKAIDQLFDQFGKVDAKLHGEAGASYEEVSKEIDASLEKLQQLVPR